MSKPSKKCQQCGRRFYRRYKMSNNAFLARKFCSRPCSMKGQTRRGPSGDRTHCKSGKHEWIPENLWIDARGHKKCKRCQQERDTGRKRNSSMPRKSRAKTRVVPRPKPKPALQSVPTPVTPQRPVWRPAGFAPVPNTRRSA